MTRFYFNGVEAGSGRYIHPPMSRHTFADLLPYPTSPPTPSGMARGVVSGVDIDRLDSAGWGIVFPDAQSTELQKQLAPLIKRRRAQAGSRFRLLTYRREETRLAFLKRHGMGPGRVDPVLLPYFLLLVGGPDQIPFAFQFQMDIQYAVGRISFDTLEAYGHYAENVVDAELGRAKRRRQISFFGVGNCNDPLTRLSRQILLQPLQRSLTPRTDGWHLESFQGEAAQKRQLSSILAQEEGCALLFTISHGVLIPEPGKQRLQEQGALICADWRGPDTPLLRSHYFGAQDIPQSADLRGLVSVLFACFSGGTPWPRIIPGKKPGSEFVARLPMAMLGRPKGAQAVVAHVDEVFEHSFIFDSQIGQVGHFQSLCEDLMQGQRVGVATRHIKERFSQIATDLAEVMFDQGGIENRSVSLDLRIGYYDARNYILLGDPAVRFNGVVPGLKASS